MTKYIFNALIQSKYRTLSNIVLIIKDFIRIEIFDNQNNKKNENKNLGTVSNDSIVTYLSSESADEPQKWLLQRGLSLL